MVFVNLEGLTNPDASLEKQNAFSLNQHNMDTLRGMCVERNMPADGGKLDLVRRLVQWKSANIRSPYNLRNRGTQDAQPINVRIAAPTPEPAGNAYDVSMGAGGASAAIPVRRPSVLAARSSNSSLMLSAQLMDIDGGDSGEIPYDAVKVGRKLGSGGFKDCYAGVYNGLPVAIGKLRTTDITGEDLEEMRHEMGVLRALRHDNIVNFIGVCYKEKHLSIVTELCENGDLYEYMKRTPRPPFAQQMAMMHDIAHGVAYLHSRRPPIVHRDLKSQNILVSGSKRAKINDFGLARIVPNRNTLLHTKCGTPNWQAPEMWASTPSYTEKVDVYACGLIFWEILQWAHEPFPYHNMKEAELYRKVRDHNARPDLNKLVRRYPSSLLVLIARMWDGDSQKRPSMNTVLDHLNEY